MPEVTIKLQSLEPPVLLYRRIANFNISTDNYIFIITGYATVLRI